MSDVPRHVRAECAPTQFVAETENTLQRSGMMSRVVSLCTAAALLVWAAGAANVQAGHRAVTFSRGHDQ
jgi:hypothetical protein